MQNKSPFGRKLLNAVESVDVFKKLKQADKRKMARLKRQSDFLDEALDEAKINRNLVATYRSKKYGSKPTYHALTSTKEWKARQKRLKK